MLYFIYDIDSKFSTNLFEKESETKGICDNGALDICGVFESPAFA